MFANFIIFVLVIFVIYIFTLPDNQLTATSSVIREIFSGSCRLNCRRSRYSRLSELSGIPPGNSQDSKGLLVARTSIQGSSDCVCPSCPCAYIESLLSTFRPAATMYSTGVSLLARMYYSAIETLSNMYSYVEGVINCRTSCQRTQLVETKDSEEAVYFGNKRKGSIEKVNSTKTESNSKELRSSRSIVFRDISDTKANKRDEDSSKSAPDNYPMNTGIFDATSKPKKEDKENMPITSGESNGCSKCIEQGKICMKNCPRAVKKKK